MLTQLYIKNFALIEELDVEFHKGFSVITGETGAGKSIILGALGLLLGNRADAKTIKEGCNKCIIEGHFSIGRYNLNSFFEENDIEKDDECILRREVSSNGKSRAFINDTPVGLSQMKELGSQLIDIHSQHQNLLLQKDDFQLSVVDIIAKNKSVLEEYTQQYNEYHHLENELQRVKDEIERNKSNADFIRFQYEELQRLNLKKDEDIELSQMSDTMQHSEDIKRALYEADSHLGDEETGILKRLYRLLASLRSIERVYPNVSEAIERFDSAYTELKDLSSDVADMMDSIDYDPDKLEEINDRLDAIYTLEQKHHVNTIDELLAIQAEYGETLNNIDNSEECLGELQSKVDAAYNATKQQAEKLTSLRIKAAKAIEKEMAERLKPLGLPNVRFAVEISSKDFSADGADRISFLFSANPGTPLYPISQIASGGEIARVMLSLKAMLSGAVNLPTIIFDEIDTGVSGRVAEQMASIMKEMGEADRQVVSITHLPQIAAAGKHHYTVYKEQNATTTSTHMKALTQEERVNEIAQMLSGSTISTAAIVNAKELLGY